MSPFSADAVFLPPCTCGGATVWLLPHERVEHGRLVRLGQFLSCIPCGAVRVYMSGEGKA